MPTSSMWSIIVLGIISIAGLLLGYNGTSVYISVIVIGLMVWTASVVTLVLNHLDG